MSEIRKFYVICEDNCKFESMTKEQIVAAIVEATGNTPTNVDAAFITKIKEQNSNNPVKIWIGTQAEYNALTEKDGDTVYFYDDTNIEDLQKSIINIINGTTPVAQAKNALNANRAINAEYTDITNSDWQINAVDDLEFEDNFFYQLIAIDEQDGGSFLLPFFFYAPPSNVIVSSYFELASTVITKTDSSNNLSTITEYKLFGTKALLPSGNVGVKSLSVTKTVYNKNSSGFTATTPEKLLFIYRKIR